MKYALLQPNWDFTGSSYFGCRETHMPLELLFARQQLEAAGHAVLLLDAHLEALAPAAAARRIRAFAPDFTVITTAPSYLFWRCPQPELRVPAAWLAAVRGGGVTVAIGPHPSATPAATLRKLPCDVALRGEPDGILPLLASRPWTDIAGCCWRADGSLHLDARLPQADMQALGALDWRDYPLALRRHRHHVFSGEGRGAELEYSRGCPWNCTFCNKQLFRNRFRARPVAAVLAEAEVLAGAGFDYVYFIDEIFGCGTGRRELLEGLAQLPLSIGMETRIDLWEEDSLEQLARAHCISMECGIESITPEGRERFAKNCRLSTARIAELLRFARQRIPWVQANLIAEPGDDRAAIAAWRQELISAGVWVSAPVPVFAFPGSPLFTELFGPPAEDAWERAHAHYLASNAALGFSDIQEAAPRPLADLESA